jgi:hypothetical protein
MRVYHFFLDDGTTSEGGCPVIVGETMRVEGDIVPCRRGLHGSVRALHALRYAPGSMVQIAELGGTIIPHGNPVDKYAASERTCIAKANVEQELRAFARWCALRVVHYWDAPQIVHDYLTTGDEALQDTALSASDSALWAPLHRSATISARAAMRAATRAATRLEIQQAVPSNAARDAARAAAWASANHMWPDATHETTRDAALAAVWAVALEAAQQPEQTERGQAFCKAWDAEYDKQNKKLEALIGEALARQNA